MSIFNADERRALVVLAAAGQNGVTQRFLSAYGFDTPMIAWLVNHGLATMTGRTFVRAAS